MKLNQLSANCVGAKVTMAALFLSFLFLPLAANAALSLDRTRVILGGDDKTVSLNVTNQNKDLPYLAQAWIEDEQGNKISSPLTALPPVQRVEAGAKTQVKIQTTGINILSQDKESLYYFNLREIPPKGDKPNTLQIALQTRIKLFYRPASLKVDQNSKPWQEKVTLTREGDHYIAHNPTPYYVTFTAASSSPSGGEVKGFTPVMIPPKGSISLGSNAKALGNNPILTYVNDYGGRPKLIFSCTGNSCSVKNSISG